MTLQLSPIVTTMATCMLFIAWCVVAAFICSMDANELHDYYTNVTQSLASTSTAAALTSATAAAATAAASVSSATNTSVTLPTVPSATGTNLVNFLFVYFFFGFLWTNQVIRGVGNCTVIGSFSHLYWTRQPRRRKGRLLILGMWARLGDSLHACARCCTCGIWGSPTLVGDK